MALVVERGHGESVKIGKDITVTVWLEDRGYGPQIKLAIDAPRDIKILRTELVLPGGR